MDEHIAMTLIDIYYKYCLYCSFTPPLENIRKLVLWVRGCLEQYPASAFICSIRAEYPAQQHTLYQNWVIDSEDDFQVYGGSKESKENANYAR